MSTAPDEQALFRPSEVVRPRKDVWGTAHSDVDRKMGNWDAAEHGEGVVRSSLNREPVCLERRTIRSCVQVQRARPHRWF